MAIDEQSPLRIVRPLNLAIDSLSLRFIIMISIMNWSFRRKLHDEFPSELFEQLEQFEKDRWEITRFLRNIFLERSRYVCLANDSANLIEISCSSTN